MSKLYLQMIGYIFHYRTGTLSNQKSTTAQAPFLIRNMLFPLRSPLAFSVHSVSK